MRIGHLAAAHQLQVSPHVAHELSLPVVGALANGFLVEYMDWHPPTTCSRKRRNARTARSASPTGRATASPSRAAAMKKYRTL